MTIRFFSEQIDFILPHQQATRTWIQRVITEQGKSVGLINYIFCSDDYLHRINLAHLAHDTLTDVISFDYSEEEAVISGDIYISIDCVKQNAKKFQVTFGHELARVIIHGILHFLGFHDKTPAEKTAMRAREDAMLLLEEVAGLREVAESQ